MASNIKSNVSALARELKVEIKELERDLAERKELLAALEKLAGTTKSPGRPKSSSGTKAPKKGKRRKSKNRDKVLSAAASMSGTFSLQELIEKIHKKDSGFGGKYPSSTLITVLKTTPEIKKVKRGTYKYNG